jgi:ribonuclease P protein component
MRRAADFTAVLRDGDRARRGCVVVHQRRDFTSGPALVGLIVGKAVGGSVVRHRVSRRLRAQLAARLGAITDGSGIVVRALRQADGVDSAELGRDLDAAFTRVNRVSMRDADRDRSRGGPTR